RLPEKIDARVIVADDDFVRLDARVRRRRGVAALLHVQQERPRVRLRLRTGLEQVAEADGVNPGGELHRRVARGARRVEGAGLADGRQGVGDDGRVVVTDVRAHREAGVVRVVRPG